MDDSASDIPRISQKRVLLLLMFYCFYFIVLSFFFWPHCMACRILVPPPGIEPTPTPALEAWSLNHWTTREVPPTVSSTPNVCSTEDHCGAPSLTPI